MSIELKCAIMASVLMFGVSMHGAAREDGLASAYGYTVALLAIVIVAIGLFGRE